MHKCQVQYITSRKSARTKYEKQIMHSTGPGLRWWLGLRARVLVLNQPILDLREHKQRLPKLRPRRLEHELVLLRDELLHVRAHLLDERPHLVAHGVEQRLAECLEEVRRGDGHGRHRRRGRARGVCLERCAQRIHRRGGGLLCSDVSLQALFELRNGRA